MEVVLAIVGIVLTIAGYAVPEITQSTAKNARSKLTKLARQFYTEIQGNQNLLDKLYNAYMNKQNSLINSIMIGAGFGDRMDHLRKSLNKATQEYENEKAALTKRQAKVTNAYNETTSELNNVGSSITANVQARKFADAMNQSINGGIQDVNQTRHSASPVPQSESVSI